MTRDVDPYTDTRRDQAPEPAQQRPDFPLAGRGQRLAAKVLDGLMEGLVMIPVAIYLGINQYFGAAASDELMVFPLKLILELIVAQFVVHLLLHGYLLYFYGQTIGKRLMGIAIVDADNRVPGFNRIIGLRYLPFFIAAQLPWISGIALANVLFIFRQDRRCLHDMLAGTRVIDVSRTKAA